MPASITELREATAFSPAPMRSGEVPFAGPKALTRWASRFEDEYLDVQKDGPRRLDDTPQLPYWATLPRAISRPLMDRPTKSQILSLLYMVGQHTVDTSVGICALALALYYVGKLKPNMAAFVISHHAVQVTTAAFVAATGCLLGVCTLL